MRVQGMVLLTSWPEDSEKGVSVGEPGLQVPANRNRTGLKSKRMFLVMPPSHERHKQVSQGHKKNHGIIARAEYPIAQRRHRFVLQHRLERTGWAFFNLNPLPSSVGPLLHG